MSIWQPLRYTVRTLRQSPGYTLTCIAVLALGIGANAALFSVINSVILKSLSFPHADRLVFVWDRFPSMPDPIGSRMQVARANLLEWQRRSTAFAQMAAYHLERQDETGTGKATRIRAGYSSANLLPLLGAKTSIGRLFRSEEEQPGRDLVAIISDHYFEQRFQRDPSVLGKSVTIDKASYQVIGVLPADFHLPSTYEGENQDEADTWMPLSRRWTNAEADRQHQLQVIGELKPNATLGQARSEIAAIAARMAETNKETNEGWLSAVYPIAVEDTNPRLHHALAVLAGAVGFLLLIACANLANLTLARATLRSREIAVRLALGATRVQIVTQLLMESLVLSLAGAGAGLLLAWAGVSVLPALRPAEMQRVELIRVDAWVFLFATVAALLTTALFGLVPAFTTSRQDPGIALKVGGRTGSSSRVRSRQFLIAAEVAIALVLVTGAALMIRSFQRLTSIGIGFSTAHLMGGDVELPEKRYPTPASRSQFLRELMRRVSALPGVSGVAATDNLPLHSVSMANFYLSDQLDPPKNAVPISDMARVTPNYFELLHVPMRAGRGFDDADSAQAEKDVDGRVIVNEAFVDKFLRGQQPLGKRLLLSDKKRAYEIVGVVANYRPMGVENGVRPQIFWPSYALTAGSLLIRTAGTGLAFPVVQQAVWSLDREMAMTDYKEMEERWDEMHGQRWFNTLLLTVFAGLALVLALLGIYGALSHLVGSRVREIGIRMAIGAQRSEIASLLIRQGMTPVVIGLMAGLAGSLVLSRYLESLLFEVKARDPLVLAAAVVVVLLLAPLALYVPTRRATQVDCTVALRED